MGAVVVYSGVERDEAVKAMVITVDVDIQVLHTTCLLGGCDVRE